MAVTVIVSRHGNGGIHTQDVYADGVKINTTSDGHLVVATAGGSPIGIYSPGKWVQAFKDETAEIDAS